MRSTAERRRRGRSPHDRHRRRGRADAQRRGPHIFDDVLLGAISRHRARGSRRRRTQLENDLSHATRRSSAGVSGDDAHRDGHEPLLLRGWAIPVRHRRTELHGQRRTLPDVLPSRACGHRRSATGERGECRAVLRTAAEARGVQPVRQPGAPGPSRGAPGAQAHTRRGAVHIPCDRLGRRGCPLSRAPVWANRSWLG